MPANVEGMIRAGVEAYRAGNKIEARALLEKAIELDDYNEEAWLWLSAAVDTKEEQRTCLENVLVINPSNERAQKGLAALEPAVPDTPPEPESPFSTTDTAQPFSDFDFSADPDSDFDISENTATSEPQWDDTIATSSASSTFQPPSLSPNDYDSWVNSLNLGGATAPETSQQPNSSVFRDEPAEAIDVFESATTEANSAFSSFDTDSFDIDSINDTNFEDSTFDDNLFGDTPLSDSHASASAPAPAMASPGNDNFLDDFDANLEPDDVFGEDDLTDLSQFDSIEQLSDPSGADFLFDDEDEEAEEDPKEMFRLIPPSIKANRLPGTVESVSGGLKAVVGLLVLLNIGAIAAIVIQVVA